MDGRASLRNLGHGLGLTIFAIVGLVACGADDAPASDGSTNTDAIEAKAAADQTGPSEAETAMMLVRDAPAAVRDAVALDPESFLRLVEQTLAQPANRTLLVDKALALAADYVPEDLVELDTLSDRLVLSRPGHRLTSDATDALLEMSADAASEGITLVVSSAYRSYDYQEEVYARWVERLGQEEADRVSARPGTSQHQLGTVIDFGCICDEFASQAAGRWLAENASRFGFSLSYPAGYEEVTGYSYEPWHFRYIGAAATELESSYFAGIQQWMLEFLDKRTRGGPRD